MLTEHFLIEQIRQALARPSDDALIFSLDLYTPLPDSYGFQHTSSPAPVLWQPGWTGGAPA